jgi:hypothetical protein
VSVLKDVDLNYEDVLMQVEGKKERVEVDRDSGEDDEWGESQESEEDTGIASS